MRINRWSIPLSLCLLLQVTPAGADPSPMVPPMDRASQCRAVDTAEGSRSALEFGPDGDIFFLRYDRRIGDRGELAFGAIYHDSGLLDLLGYPGRLRSLALELGFREYLWRGLHAEAAVLPQIAYAEEDGVPGGHFRPGLALELRLGYQADFRVARRVFFLNLQFFAGCFLLNPKPQSFKEVDGGDWYASPIPMFLLGLRL